MKVLAINTDWSRPNCDGKYGGVGWYRIINPFSKIGADVQSGKFEIGTPEIAIDMARRGNVIVSKPVDEIKAGILLLTAKDFTESKFVLDIDDHPFAVDDAHPMREKLLKTQKSVEMLIDNADHIIVSTERLKSIIAPRNNRITVLKNAIDPSIWKVRPTKKYPKKKGVVRIGWIGSASHIADIPIIFEVLREITQKYRNVEVILCGMVTDDFGGRIRHIEGTKGYEEFPQFLSDLRLDIGIAPLKHSEFNDCKSNIKWLEHSMLEIPMVLSDELPYRCVQNYKTGYLAKNHSQWVKYLSWLIESSKKRKEIGKNAKKEVLKNWLIADALPKYKKLMRRLLKKNIVVYTSITGKKDRLQPIKEEYLEEARFVAFTEQNSNQWEIKKPYDKFRDDRRNSRTQKILPHLYFDEEYSIYLDGNIRLNESPKKIIEKYLKDKDIAVFRHPGRDCVYQEAHACLALQKETTENLDEQVNDYLKKGVKLNGGLAECGVILRRNTAKTRAMDEAWWAHYCRYGVRDQISFPVTHHLNDIRLLEGGLYRSDEFVMENHLNEQ